MHDIATPEEVLHSRLRQDEPLGHPAALVLLDQPGPLLNEALQSLRTAQLIVIGVTTKEGSLPPNVIDGCDLIIAPRGHTDRAAVTVENPVQAAEHLQHLVAANPHATTVLADVLRATAELPVVDALHIESLAYSALLSGSEFARWRGTQPDRPIGTELDPPVLITRENDTLTITLNRPEKRNAYSAPMRDHLVEALTLAEADPGISRITLNGAGPSFCAGGDLAEFGVNRDGGETHLLRTRGGAAAPLHRLAGRIEATIHGHCVGAGIELPAFAHRVRAHNNALLRLPEVAMGLIPGAGGTVSIPRRIGRHRTFWLALTGESLDAQTALAWGLVDEVVHSDDVAA